MLTASRRVAFYTMLEEHLRLPFETDVLGIPVSVERIDMTDDDQIVAICRRGRSRQSIPILDIRFRGPRGGGGMDRGLPRLGARGVGDQGDHQSEAGAALRVC
jgi:hypothetical protein